MKGIRFYLLFVFVVMSNLYGQVPNLNFENWSNGSPTGWVTNNSVAFNIVCVQQSSEAYSGASAAKLLVANVMGTDFGPYMATVFPASDKYFNISGFYKFSPMQGDILSIAIAMSKNGKVVADGTLDISEATSVYKQFRININYGFDVIPDSCKIFVVIGSKDNQTAAHSGSYALIDNLTFNNLGSSINNLSLPNDYTLYQNYPNPFNPVTTIKYSIAKQGYVTLKVYDELGKEITTLVNDEKLQGNYEADFHGENLSNGVYYYQLKTADFTQTKKMILLK